MAAEDHIIGEIVNLHAEVDRLRAENARLKAKAEQLQHDLDAMIRQNDEGPLGTSS